MRNPMVRAPQNADLSAPVGAFMRPTLTVEEGDSLARAAQSFRENGAAVLPVVRADGRLLGGLTDAGLARALSEAGEPTDAVDAFVESVDSIPPYATAAEALERCADGRTRVVADDAGRVVGVVAAVDFWPRRRQPPKPAMVGGMATPFGVYLTTGGVSAGARWWALMATGASMTAMLVLGDGLATAAISHGLPPAAEAWVAGLLFFLIMRLSPLSGIHGAEHQVVNAIEREEPLTLDVVRRMSRIHPRCGTNLMVGMAIFGTLLFVGQGPAILRDDLVVRLLPAVILSVIFARPLGAVVQCFVTTKRPTDRQLENAIRAGEALLQRNASARYASANPFGRLWHMGLLQVMTGASLLTALLAVVKDLTGATWLPDVR